MDDIILLSHGGGGTKTQKLIDDIIKKHLGNPILDQFDDAASLEMPGRRIAFTTDSFVVQPIFFPGGNIGSLAACGTLNDLVMQGAQPEYISLGLILEEGLAMRDLDTIVESLAAMVKEAGAMVVTGDTKVIERGLGSGIAINTSGVGTLRDGVDVHVGNAKPGDVIIVTGTIGDHGITIMGSREGLKFESELESDVASLNGIISALLDVVPDIHCLRDPTRGGLAAAVCDIASRSACGIVLDENTLPLKPSVVGACSMLGLDPINVANEGKAVVVCPGDKATEALSALRSHPLGTDSAVVGTVTAEHPGMVLLDTKSGGQRIVEIPSGEDLPRIC